MTKNNFAVTFFQEPHKLMAKKLGKSRQKNFISKLIQNKTGLKLKNGEIPAGELLKILTKTPKKKRGNRKQKTNA